MTATTVASTVKELMKMINEICKLHTKLTFNKRIVCVMSRYDYETVIKKDDLITKVNDHILKIVRPSGEVCLLNGEYVLVCFMTAEKRW